MLRVCVKCSFEGEEEEYFYLRDPISGTRDKTCKKCRVEKGKEYYANNRKGHKERISIPYEKRYERKKRTQREWNLRKYGLTEEQFSTMLLAQGNRCAICGSSEEVFHVDHSHETGEVRGILCGSCNRGLGCFRDRPERLVAAVEYLNTRKSAIAS